MSPARLEVWEHNRRARVFCERRGWELDGHRRTDRAGGLAHVGYRLLIPGE